MGFCCTLDVEPIGRAFSGCELREYSGDLCRDAGAHRNAVNSREHRSVDRKQVRKLNFLKVVDPDRLVMPFFCEPDFTEISREIKRDEVEMRLDRKKRNVAEARLAAFFHGTEIFFQHVFRERRYRKMFERPSHVSVLIARFEPARKHVSDGRTRY